MGNSEVAALDLSADTPEVVELVTQFHQSARKSAEGVLEMARVVKAASVLQTSDFHRFCERTGLKAQSSTTRKLIVIGNKYSFLISQADKLPANWTIVYAVAKLANQQIQTLIDQGVVNANTATAELERALRARTDNRLAQALSLAAAQPSTSDASTSAAPTPTPSKRLPGFKVELSAHPEPATLAALTALIQQISALDQTKVTLNDALESVMVV
jgi:hypothetical protein